MTSTAPLPTISFVVSQESGRNVAAYLRIPGRPSRLMAVAHAAILLTTGRATLGADVLGHAA